MCKASHCLPDVGGLKDQDPLYVVWLCAVLEAESEIHRLEIAKSKRGKK